MSDVDAPQGLARLPPELLDLVCSFVRELPPATARTTLCSLCRTAKPFLDAARRALLYDPTRLCSVHPTGWRRALVLQHLLLAHPERNSHVKELSCLVVLEDACWNPLDDPGSLEFANWTLCLLRLCPHITSIDLAPNDADLDWPLELARLPNLRNLTLRINMLDEYVMDDQLPRYFVFLATLPLRGLRYLTLHNCEISSTVLSPVPPVLLPLVDLELLDCYVASPGYSAAPLDLRNVRRLWIEPATVGKNLQSLIPHDLEQLSYRPVRSRDGTDMLFSSPDRPRQWPCPVDSFKPFPRLTFLVLEFVRVDFARFQDIVTSCPNLQHLDLTDSIWLEGGSVLRDSDFPEEGLACALEHVPQLRFLALGYIPFGRNYFFGEPVPHVLQTACRQREIDFRWQRAALSDGGSGSSAYRDDHFGFEHQDPDEDPSGQSNEGVADRAPQVSRNSLPSPSPSASSAWSFAGPDDSTADSTNRYRLWNLPRVDRNPLDADDAPSAPASLVDGQEYVEREADEPRLEEGFQAREDEEGLEEEAEPWREWADASDVAEADRMWREFDDGGAGEVVVSSP